MKIRILIAVAALVLWSAPALAFHCTKDIAKIDGALAAGPNLSADQITEVKALRDKGESLHKAGKHGDAVTTLAKALKILKIKTKSSRYTY